MADRLKVDWAASNLHLFCAMQKSARIRRHQATSADTGRTAEVEKRQLSSTV